MTVTPPHDLDAERSLLGSMILSQTAIADSVAIVRGHDFYQPHHEVVFDAISRLYSAGNPTDAISLADALGKAGDLNRVGGPSYLHELVQSVPTAANADYYAEIVRDRAVLRRLVIAGTRIVQMGSSHGEGEVEDIVNRAQAEVYAVNEERGTHDYHMAGELIGESLAHIEAAANRGGEMTGIPTGFLDLDKMTHGLHPGQLVVVAARPAVGKSTFALDAVRHAAIGKGHACAFFSLEMGRLEIMDRIYSAEATLPLQDIRRGLKGQDQWTKLASVVDSIAAAPLFIDDSPNMTLMEIRSKARRLKQQHDLRLLVIDYLQLLTSGARRVESRQQEVAEFSRALKLLAKELEIPVVAISQLNRGSESRADKRPQMSDLRESGAIEQDSDVVILLHRDRDDPEREGEADVIVAKQRNGPTGDVVVAFQGHYSRFSNMASDY